MWPLVAMLWIGGGLFGGGWWAGPGWVAAMVAGGGGTIPAGLPTAGCADQLIGGGV